MKKLTTHHTARNQEQSFDFIKEFDLGIMRFVFGVLFIFMIMQTCDVHGQEILSKPESINVYAQAQTIAIEANKEIDYLELWDVSKSKRRLKFKPRQQSIIVNTQRLKKSDYQIVLFFGNDTKLIKFSI